MIPFTHQRIISFGDTDAAGLVYTPRFPYFCMEAAECWFRDFLDFDWYRINTELDMGTPVVHMEIDFAAPLVGGDRLEVEVVVDRVGRSTASLRFKGMKGAQGALSFTGLIIFCFTQKNKGAVPIPARQRDLIEQYMAACNARLAEARPGCRG